MEQNTEIEKPIASAANNKQKDGNGLIIIAIIACIVAACGIGLGAYGIMQSSQRDDRISELETQLADIKSEIQNNTSGNINNNEGAIINNDIDEYEDVIVDNSATLGFDFDAMLTSLKSSIKNSGMVPIMSKCTNYEDAKGEPVSDCKYTVLSESTIENVIKKLKSAESVDKEITYSFIGVAPEVTYLISTSDLEGEVLGQKVFSLNYSSPSGPNDDVILVGFDGKGYAFHFGDSKEIDGFIESLASVK